MPAGSVLSELTQVLVCNTGSDLSRTQLSVDKQQALDKMVEGVDESITTKQRLELAGILMEYESVFAFGGDEIGRTSVTRHEIDTGDARPVRQWLRRQPIAYQEIINNEIEIY